MRVSNNVYSRAVTILNEDEIFILLYFIYHSILAVQTNLINFQMLYNIIMIKYKYSKPNIYSTVLDMIENITCNIYSF